VDQIDGEQENVFRNPVARGSERRQQARRSGIWAAQLETAQSPRRNCLVLDVSSSGAKLRIDQPAALGEIVTLIAERFGTRRGRVVWTANHRIGITFVDEFGVATTRAPTSDPHFLRSRAEMLQRLARSAQGGDATVELLRLARALEVEAGEIERQHSTPPSGR
jgi:hypothetical protein